jgi:hypothetical protein
VFVLLESPAAGAADGSTSLRRFRDKFTAALQSMHHTRKHVTAFP